jgi:two-component system nitrogen regulation sensor histidine kinase NtrY
MTAAEKKNHPLRNLAAIVILFALVIMLTVLVTYLQGIRFTFPVGSNIIIVALININIILLMVLVLLVLRNLIKLYFERRQNILGSKFRTRLVIAFVSLSSIPALILFLVSLKLITSSIQNWFNVQVEESLRSSSEMATIYYRNTDQSLLHTARRLSEEIARQHLFESYNRDRLQIFLREKQRDYRLTAIEVYSRPGEPDLRLSNPDFPVASLHPADPEQIRSALAGNGGTKIQASPDWDIFRAAWPVVSPPSRKVRGVVVVNYLIPDSLRGKMAAATKTFENYQQLKLYRLPIQTSYKMTLGMIALLITFAATWFAFYLARGITIPIQKLAEGTRRVAEGDLNFEISTRATDEIGLLVSSFNRMTRDIKANKAELETAYLNLQTTNLELDQRRNVIETILGNIFTGVLSISPLGIITTLNRSAEKMLGISSVEAIDHPYREVFQAPALSPVLESLDQVRLAESRSWEGRVSLTLGANVRTLVVNAVGLKSEGGENLGQLVVFEDLTQLIKAQRIAAWREVARRIAHEIKNPLTPIQLSVQRVRKKYLEKAPDYDQVFHEATQTIGTQVDELKRLVDEFSRFARLPSMSLSPVDIHEIIEDTLKIYRPNHRHLEFRTIFHDAPLLIDADPEQLKRVFINLIENSLEAMEGGGLITFETVPEPVAQLVKVKVSDTGRGLPEQDRDKLFLPYFSTKKGGTGLGLAIINDIVAAHNGHIRFKDNFPRGAVFILEFPLLSPVNKPAHLGKNYGH